VQHLYGEPQPGLESPLYSYGSCDVDPPGPRPWVVVVACVLYAATAALLLVLRMIEPNGDRCTPGPPLVLGAALFVSLAIAAQRVRPRVGGRKGEFAVLFAPIVAHALVLFASAAGAVLPRATDLSSPHLPSWFERAAMIGFLLGWAPTITLVVAARRALALLLIQVALPLMMIFLGPQGAG
jgi:hypothetical protein